jgi:hypothetical protein
VNEPARATAAKAASWSWSSGTALNYTLHASKHPNVALDAWTRRA